MDFSKTDTKILLKTWVNLKKGLDEVDKSIKKGTFRTVGEKGAAPPSQSGQTTLWFALAVDAELTKRGVGH
jgi:hypothetical protein